MVRRLLIQGNEEIGVIDIVTVCPACKNRNIVRVEYEPFLRYVKGAKVQEAFPDLSIDVRESLISGFCSQCWNEIFADTDK